MTRRQVVSVSNQHPSIVRRAQVYSELSQNDSTADAEQVRGMPSSSPAAIRRNCSNKEGSQDSDQVPPIITKVIKRYAINDMASSMDKGGELNDRSNQRDSLQGPLILDEDDMWPDEHQHEKRRRRSNEFRDWVSSTTFHGIGQAAAEESSCSTRIFWTITMIVVFCVVFIQLKTLVLYFVANPTVTSIDVIYPKNGLELPSISLCTLAKLNKTKVEQMYPNVSKHVAEFAMTSFMSAYSTALMDLTYFNSSNMSIVDLEEQLWLNTGRGDIKEFIYNTTFTCENQFKMCWFENGHLFDCCADNEYITVKRHLTHSGACFEFKPNVNTSRQRLPGPVGGFGFMYWFPNEHIYQTAYNSYNEHAVQLYMSAVDSMLENNPISLPIGYHSHLNLQATETERQMVDELGRSTCKPSHLKYFDSYSYQACQVECLVDMMKDKCIHDYMHLPQDQVCTPLEAVQCYSDLAYNFTDLLVDCRQEKCLEACRYWSYGASLTVASVFHPCCSEEMAKYWHTPPGDPFESLIIADVYFGDIKYTKVTQKSALTIETFVSSIGGAMGLWTGASIITWIHLFYFCCATLSSKMQIRKQNRDARRSRPAVRQQSEQHLMNSSQQPNGTQPQTSSPSKQKEGDTELKPNPSLKRYASNV